MQLLCWTSHEVFDEVVHLVLLLLQQLFLLFLQVEVIAGLGERFVLIVGLSYLVEKSATLITTVELLVSDHLVVPQL